MSDDATAVQPLPVLAGAGAGTGRRGAAPAPAPVGAPWGALPPPPARSGFFGGPDSMRWVAVVAVAALVAGAIVGGAYWYANVRVPTFPMPALKGQSLDQVPELTSPELIEARRWTVDRQDVYHDTAPRGLILEQWPATDTDVNRNGSIRITVSKGAVPMPVPTDLAGKSVSEASAALGAVGLRPREAERPNSEEAPAGQVISVVPGTPVEVPKGGEVGLIVSAGPAPRTVPVGLEGRPVADVVNELNGLQLKPGRSDVFDDVAPAGTVMKVEPAGGTQVPRGTQVKVTVSKGSNVVEIPDFSGRTGIEAATELQRMGLEPEVQGVIFFGVKAVSPPAGTKVRPGERVVVVTGL